MLTIGAVSQATGIPVNTIRTWERRYNFPPSNRSPGRQRLYSPEIITHLRLINQALSQGLRPRQIMALDYEELQQLIGETVPKKEPISEELKEWLKATKELNSEVLDNGFRISMARLGLYEFLTERVSPFLILLGKSWTEGKLEIFQEHFASQRISHLLNTSWRTLSDGNQGKLVLCASLPGEQHYLGLQMAAAIIALNGYRIMFLGPKTPLLDIQACAWQSQAYAVMLSISITTPQEEVTPKLHELRELLSPSTQMLLGGSGAPVNIMNTIRMTNFTELSSWAKHNLDVPHSLITGIKS